MPVATTYSSAELGIAAPPVVVEADASPGLPQTLIVGLPQTAVRESKDRVKAAIHSCGLHYPSQRITVNLAPADLPKAGGRYDLAIAVSILAASGQLPADTVSQYEFLGELSLTGQLRAVNGVLPAALRQTEKRRFMVIPGMNSQEGIVSGAGNLFAADDLNEVVSHILGRAPLQHLSMDGQQFTANRDADASEVKTLSDVHGQLLAKRALTIAAAGMHNMILVGPPGTGKTMLASRLPNLIPAISREESLELASIQSVSRQTFNLESWGHRPFRAPHHTASAAAMVGGGNPPVPGEISLAHKGVLFLDELPEFSRQVLEVLREPLESGAIHISRASRQVQYPADFQLIAAMNPCPCGYAGDERIECCCSPDQVTRYRNRVSGPLMDRMDLQIEVPPIPVGSLGKSVAFTPDDKVKGQIQTARSTMLERQGCSNARMGNRDIHRYCRLSKADRRYLDEALSKLGISTRGYYKILKVARTIADLSGADSLTTNHLMEAIGCRSLDRRS